LTHEFLRAVETYHFSYAQLKRMVRASLEYSFLPGESLWQRGESVHLVSACARDHAGSDKASPLCRKFLGSNEKASVQWKLEGEYGAFESRF
jgi:hypothetical protein